jgi:imidazolonepropionase-like amidohydrolase
MRIITGMAAVLLVAAAQAEQPGAGPATVLHAARLLEIESGRVVSPGEVLVQGERIVAVGSSVNHPPGAPVIDLGDTTLMPGLIDVHVHLFLHPGAEDLQTVAESVATRTILATLAAEADVMAGYTAERDMGTEGAGSADTAVRDAINKGLIPGPRLRISGNAIDILGGHEDANGFNPEQHVLSNAAYANSADEVVATIREQHKQGADFAKLYETGRDEMRNGVLHTPYQYSFEQLKAAVTETARFGSGVAVASIAHATQLSEQTMRLMKEKNIPAVPTFTVFEYFIKESPERAAREQEMLDYKVKEFHKQIAAGVPFAVGSDVGPFPHGTQSRELVLMVKYGMKPLAALQADLLNGAKLLGWGDQIGALKVGYYADIIAVPGSPLDDIANVSHVAFVMKNGVVVRRE